MAIAGRALPRPLKDETLDLKARTGSETTPLEHFSPWLSRYAKLLAGVSFLLVMAGGLVTSTSSGLAVPDWPLSYGQWMPPMVGGVRYEHAHRIIAALVGVMTLTLALWLGFSEPRPWVRWTGIAALGMVVIQGILGGMTVLYLLPAPISIFHACLAQTFFALVVSLAFFTSREWMTPEAPLQEEGTIKMKQPLFLLIALLYLQLILGATLRHTANHLIAISHAASGFLVLIHAAAVMIRAHEIETVTAAKGDSRHFVYPASFLGILTLLQMALGIGAFIYTSMVRQAGPLGAGRIFFVTAHQTLGALLLATSVFLAFRIYRRAY